MKSSTSKFTERNWPVPLRELIEGRWKQADLAARAELQPSAISQYVNGSRTPGAWEIYRLAKALDTTVEFLLTGEERTSGLLMEPPPARLSPEVQRLASELAEKARALELALKKI